MTKMTKITKGKKQKITIKKRKYVSKQKKLKKVSKGDNNNTVTDIDIRKIIKGVDESRIKDIYLDRNDLSRKNYDSFCKILSDDNKKVHELEGNRIKYAKYCNNNSFLINNIDNSFRVLSYNVHNFVNICQHIKPPRNLNSFLDIISNINSDIVCLQEVVPINKKPIKDDISLDNIYDVKDVKNVKDVKDVKDINFNHVTDSFEKIGYKYHYIIDSNKGENYEMDRTCYYPLANAIFSKYKLNNVVSYILPGNRSVIIADFKYNNIPILILNTHLEYSNKHKDKDRISKKYGSNKIVNIQESYIMKLIKSEKKNRNINNVILCGDLNNEIDKFSKEFRHFFKFGTQGDLTTLYMNRKIDYILLNNNTDIDIINTGVIKLSYSDHLPLYSDFAINIDNESRTNNDKIKKFIKYLNFEDDVMYIYDREYNDRRYIKIKIDNEYINNSHLDFQYWYYNDNLEPLIYMNSKFNYVKPLKELYYKFKDERFKMLMEKAKLLKPNIPLYQNPYNEEILFYYLKTRPNFKTIVLYPSTRWYESKNKKLLNKMKEYLSRNGTIYYSKKIDLNFKHACSLIYNLYLTTNRNKTIDALEYHASVKGWNKQNIKEKYPVLIFFYEYDGNQKDITGTEAFFKNKLRHIWQNDDDDEKMNKMNNMVNKGKKLGIYNILHINDYFSEGIDNTCLFLNENSITIMKMQNIKRHLQLNNPKLLFMINTFKKLLLTKFSQMDSLKFLIFSSITLYTLGIRAMKDIDGKILFEQKYDDDFMKNYVKYFTIEGDNYFSFVDLVLKDTIGYDSYVETLSDYISHIIGARDFNDIVFNPKFHYYFFGVKIPIVKYDIVKRMLRYKESAISDLIAYKTQFHLNFKLPKIPSIQYFFEKDEMGNYIRKEVSVNIKNYIKKIKFFLERKHNIKTTEDKIINMFSNISINHTLNDIDYDEMKYVFNKKLGIENVYI